mmetsp:Transcript_12850/g.30590  ORF Transcript_12850/g.30590 Transcript_12850/m.30590 type:complete len:136 (-) Transcript_12850:196-603(-)
MNWTPLHTAAQEGNVDRLQRCLDKIQWLEPLNVNAASSQGHTPLHMCAANGHTEAVIFLIKEQADPDVRTVKGNTPLHLAAMGGRADSCRVLISNGADPTIKNEKQQTAADCCDESNATLKQFLDKEVQKKVGEV